jgi:hypothetical protein
MAMASSHQWWMNNSAMTDVLGSNFCLKLLLFVQHEQHQRHPVTKRTFAAPSILAITS